ncbi:MATE family efflux transporter [Legionella sp. km772]|uniref:MATE family efflux transporter n=1 Tax=Legionella sp. km772 TaxID=2498111 RepID=UPI000F8D4807|nr:MATE family efflux transporter [Legionella sp. km772]RUR08083.1 hypothetical protein ELY15_11565 [Legionella sp. km772]
MINELDIEQASQEELGSKDTKMTHWQAIEKLSRLSLETAASYSFSMQMAMLVYLLSQLNVDEEHLAAITLITSLLNSLVCVGASPALAMALVAGKELGEFREAQKNGAAAEILQAKSEHLAAAFGNSLILSLPMSLLMITTMVNSKPLFIYGFNQDEAVADIASFFVKYYALAVPAMLVRFSADNILFAFEKTKPAMILSLVNLTLGMTIGSVLAFGKLGAPKMGVSGLLIGCVLDPWVTAAEYLVYIHCSPELKPYPFLHLYKSWTPYLAQLKEITAYTGSIAANMSVETTLSLMINIFAGMIGVEQQAAFSSIMQFSLFSFLLQIAFGQTCAQEINRQIGEAQFENASMAGKMGLLSLMIGILPVFVALSAYPSLLSKSAAENSKTLNPILQSLAPIMFMGDAFDAARFVLLQQLRVLGDDKHATAISMGCIALGIAMSGALGLKTNMGIDGVATGFALSTGLAAILLLMRWLKRIQPDFIADNKNERLSSGTLARLSLGARPSLVSIDGTVEMRTSNPMLAADNGHSTITL